MSIRVFGDATRSFVDRWGWLGSLGVLCVWNRAVWSSGGFFGEGGILHLLRRFFVGNRLVMLV